jgi:sugar lactone lactonase YvrE
MTADITSKISGSVMVDGEGSVFVLDANTSRIEKFSASGKIIARWGFGTPDKVQQPNRSEGLSVDGGGNVFLLNAETSWIQKYSPSGQLVGAWGLGGPMVGTAGNPKR